MTNDLQPEVENNKQPTLTFKVKNVEIKKNKDDVEEATCTVINPVQFFTDMNKNVVYKEFMEDVGTKRFIAKIIGVVGLLKTYNKDEVLNEISWDYVKEYFMDHISNEDILNHIGFEKVKEHFKDKIQTSNMPQNDINTTKSSCLLGELNESEGKNP